MTTQPPVDLHILYNILLRTARNRTTMTYEDVSNEYERQVGDWLHYHGTWDQPLGQINTILYGQQPSLPALSAVGTWRVSAAKRSV